MSLITPDFGLIVWMTLIFGIVFFILAKWGFPMITDSVAKRADRINDSIRMAKEAEERLKNLAEEQNKLIEQTKAEQSRILKKAAESRDAMIENAKAQAHDEAAKILAKAQTEISAERSLPCATSGGRSLCCPWAWLRRFCGRNCQMKMSRENW